ncbi:MAG: hypothetical protein UZ15_CFX003001970 [Chloroflexi bacterium OLB15]|nr:MAG: hypothetical protein UZ15_CFX003001970 [Chloroflexi bacterium OLB15]
MDFVLLEKITAELIELYKVDMPPVPIEFMLQYPLPGMWDEIDVSLVSGSFMILDNPYRPRMSLARLLAKEIATCNWGIERGLLPFQNDKQILGSLARALTMPLQMVQALSLAARIPEMMSDYFEVPAKDAKRRLEEIGSYA